MRILFYSTKQFEKNWLLEANKNQRTIEYTNVPLSINSVQLAKGYDCISIFTADDASGPVIRQLGKLGIQMIAIRAAGYDNVDIEAANNSGITIANVPEYSPYAVAEHAVTLMLALNRKIIKSNERVHLQNFLVDDLIGFDLNGKTVGIIGTGRIGAVLARIMHGFGCRILAYDVTKNQRLVSRYDVHYVALHTLCSRSDIISIHTPLNKQTKHLVDGSQIRKMKRGVMIINTARGGVVNTEDIITYLENGQIGYYGMDVYEKERGVFFFDHTGKNLNDPVLKKLLRFENVLATPHQAFATNEALKNIAATTFNNIECWATGTLTGNELSLLKEIPIQL